MPDAESNREIVFVCTGNVCRSAMAERLLLKALAAKGVSGCTVSSCGTDAMPFFRVPEVVRRLMREKDIDMSGHTPSRITGRIVAKADLILVMEVYHRHFIESLFPKTPGKVFLLKDYVGADGDPEIPDPIGKNEEDYIRTAGEIEEYVERLAERFAHHQS
jgi:protein-tyrosine-phosphatase